MTKSATVNELLKRQKKNVRNFIKFWENKGKDGLNALHDLDGQDPFKNFSAEEALQAIQLYNKDRRAFEAFACYARRFKQAATELTLEDMIEARDFMQVRKVMEE